VHDQLFQPRHDLLGRGRRDLGGLLQHHPGGQRPEGLHLRLGEPRQSLPHRRGEHQGGLHVDQAAAAEPGEGAQGVDVAPGEGTLVVRDLGQAHRGPHLLSLLQRDAGLGGHLAAGELEPRPEQGLLELAAVLHGGQPRGRSRGCRAVTFPGSRSTVARRTVAP